MITFVDELRGFRYIVKLSKINNGRYIVDVQFLIGESADHVDIVKRRMK